MVWRVMGEWLGDIEDLSAGQHGYFCQAECVSLEEAQGIAAEMNWQEAAYNSQTNDEIMWRYSVVAVPAVLARSGGK